MQCVLRFTARFVKIVPKIDRPIFSNDVIHVGSMTTDWNVTVNVTATVEANSDPQADEHPRSHPSVEPSVQSRQGGICQAVILVNGVVHNPAWLAPWVAGAHLRIAADGGLQHFDTLGLAPHALVGDLDSVAPDRVAQLAAQGVVIERHRPEKDETDLELAIDYAAKAGATEILLLGALGGRLDQTLANLLILARDDWQLPISIVEENQLATVLRAGQSLVIEGTVGRVVSLVPLSKRVTGITYTGLRYPLDNATLAFGSTKGISNEMAATEATMQIETGLALIVREIE